MPRWPRVRSFFPVTRKFVYLDHAGSGPISTRVEESLREWSDRQLRHGGVDSEVYEEEIARVRGRVASLLAVHAHEISLVRNTTEAMGLVATGLWWRSSDVVLTTDHAHPSTLYPWLALARFGVEVERLRTRAGAIDLDEAARRLESPRVRVLCVASVDYRTGARQDLAALGALCRERGVLFVVDAIQSLGCLALEPAALGIDFLAAGGQKWLLAGPGTGLLYCADAVRDRVHPRVVGWHSVQEPDALEREQHKLRMGGARFEPGTPDGAGAYRLGAAVDLILELGIDAIEDRILALRSRLDAGLDARGFHRVSPGGAAASGIASFALAHETPTEARKRLRERGVHVASRGDLLRVSAHFYNDEDEIDRLVAAL
jgi:selenocysteine lyase/cysteine desulfurase